VDFRAEGSNKLCIVHVAVLFKSVITRHGVITRHVLGLLKDGKSNQFLEIEQCCISWSVYCAFNAFCCML